METMTFFGLDPGVSGGIAWVNALGNAYNAIKMPDSRVELIELLVRLTEEGRRPTRAAIERVNPGVFGAGKAGMRMGVVSAFTFGRNVERLHMALTAARIPYDEVLPVKWQTTLGCRSKGDKNITKRRAEQLFPHIKVTHAIADALLIAEFCRRAHSGKVTPIPAGGLFDGEEGEEHEEGTDQESKGDAIARQIDEAGFGSKKAATSRAAGDGAAEDRAHRERRPRLRRRA